MKNLFLALLVLFSANFAWQASSAFAEPSPRSAPWAGWGFDCYFAGGSVGGQMALDAGGHAHLVSDVAVYGGHRAVLDLLDWRQVVQFSYLYGEAELNLSVHIPGRLLISVNHFVQGAPGQSSWATGMLVIKDAAGKAIVVQPDAQCFFDR